MGGCKSSCVGNSTHSSMCGGNSPVLCHSTWLPPSHPIWMDDVFPLLPRSLRGRYFRLRWMHFIPTSGNLCSNRGGPQKGNLAGPKAHELLLLFHVLCALF